jgi:hypothetical protein
MVKVRNENYKIILSNVPDLIGTGALSWGAQRGRDMTLTTHLI